MSVRDSDEVFYARTFAVAALALVVYLAYSVLAPFLAPIAWALFIAFLLHPTQSWLVRRFSGRPSVAAGLLTLVALLILLGPLAALGAAFVKQVAELLRYAQQYAAEHRSAMPTDLASVPVVGSALAWLEQNVGISLDQVQDWAVEAARTVLGSLATLGRSAFLGALGTVIGFLIMIFILFFAIRDGAGMFVRLRELVPMRDEDKKRLFRHLGSVTRAMVYGTGVTALVQGALVAIGFALTGLPSPIVFGVLAALFALVPMAGTPVVWVPALIALAAQGRWTAATFMLVWGGFVVTIDNFLRPMLVSGKAEVGTLTVFIGVLGGVAAFGPIGILLGPLVLALAIALVQFKLDERANVKERGG
ncbi:MAG TPA: AI-2E family transporter [Burkholderiales bacterium]|jgi:predicted PurR-regulated permease PerM